MHFNIVERRNLMRTKKLVASALAMIVVFVLGSSVFAAPEEFELKFKQTYLVTNNMSIATIPELDPFTYTLSNDVDTSFTTLNGINQIYKGDLSKVTLKTTEIDLTQEIEANTTEEVSYDIELEFSNFDKVGIYRYRLDRNDGEYVYFDIYVFNENGTPTVGGCNFYSKIFSNSEQHKVLDFLDRYEVNQEEQLSHTQNSIIRFVDQTGKKIRNDIILIRNYKDPIKAQKPIKLESRKKMAIIDNEIEMVDVATNVDACIAEYKSSLKSYLNKAYKLISDQVADNLALEAPAWFSEDDPDEVLVFVVKMKAPPSGFIGPGTGDVFNPVYYTTIALLSTGATACAIIYIRKKIKKTEKTN